MRVLWGYAARAAVVTTLLMGGGMAWGAPQLAFAMVDFDGGTVREGVQSLVKHAFVVHNSGDEPLLISQVRPSCGCTVVSFDSLIDPGAKGAIRATMDVSSMSGPVQKSITVLSNDPAQSSVKLSIRATVIPLIDPSVRYIVLKSEHAQTPFELSLGSENAALAIRTVEFRSTNPPLPPRPLRFEFVPRDGASDSSRAMVRIFAPDEISRHYGEFSFVTNHPQKPLLTIRGLLQR
jgi:hypothetical protein